MTSATSTSRKRGSRSGFYQGIYEHVRNSKYPRLMEALFFVAPGVALAAAGVVMIQVGWVNAAIGLIMAVVGVAYAGFGLLPPLPEPEQEDVNPKSRRQARKAGR